MHVEVGFFFFQAEDGIRDLVRSRGLGDVYKRQGYAVMAWPQGSNIFGLMMFGMLAYQNYTLLQAYGCLLYTSDAADDLLCVDLGGRRILKKKKQH